MEARLLTVVHWIEFVVAVALVLLTALAVIALFGAMWDVVDNGIGLEPLDFQIVILNILEIFILIELFKIALAYMQSRNVVPTVLEAALVAIARKFVVFEKGEDVLATSVGLAALLIAVAIAWWLLARSSACDRGPVD